MKRPVIWLLQIGLVMLFVTGCVHTELISDIDPDSDLSTLKSFYVVKFEPDDRGIEAIIANELNSMGYHATSGVKPSPPLPVDAIVTYQDKWMWDITMYMLELNIDLRDPKTNYSFATGRSYRTSLARKSPEEMTQEVLFKLLGDRKGEAQ
jgi:hypothetical protein